MLFFHVFSGYVLRMVFQNPVVLKNLVREAHSYNDYSLRIYIIYPKKGIAPIILILGIGLRPSISTNPTVGRGLDSFRLVSIKIYKLKVSFSLNHHITGEFSHHPYYIPPKKPSRSSGHCLCASCCVNDS